MKRIAFFLISGLAFVTLISLSNAVIAQPLVNDGVFERETIKQRIPIPYPHLREADMVWTKRIWRVLDLRERMNHPLYFPTEEMFDRVSLVQRLMAAIRLNEINAYDAINDEFTTLVSYNQILRYLDAEDRVTEDVSLITGRDTVIIVPGRIRWEQIRELVVKEEWFFDRQHSTMHVRIIGICPRRVYLRLPEGQQQQAGDLEIGGQLMRIPLFWIYYPHARTILANTAVFNTANDAQRNSFDDLFFKRRFSSYIIKESNVFNNREISDYALGGVPNMREAEKIKNDIFTREHDLWEY